MARQAENVIAVTESSKFDRVSTVPLAIPGGVRAVITDSSIRAESVEMLRQANVRVYRAE